MATCKDCVHYGICNCDVHFGFNGIQHQCSTRVETECGAFKNKADFVEVKTIKSWLYEIAMNNVGIAFDGDFSKACEDIISRLDGLKWYAIEKG